MAPTELNFITGNSNKLSEVQAILGHVVPIKSQSLDIPEIQGTIEEISRDKCRRAAAIVGKILKTPMYTTLTWEGTRTSARGRYMFVFQCAEGTAWTLHVDFFRPFQGSALRR